MQLNELINNYSIQTVSQKTNIPIETLEKLKNKDWGKFRQVQAIGLLSVIEREFEINLEEEKQECRDFFKEHEPKDANRPIDLVDAATRSGGGNSFVSVVLTIVTLGAIGYGVWFYMNKNSHNYSNITTAVANEENKTATKQNDTNNTQKIQNQKVEPQKPNILNSEKKENKKFDIITSNDTTKDSELKTDEKIDKLIETIDNANKNETKVEKNETVLIPKEQNSNQNQNLSRNSSEQNESLKEKFDIAKNDKNDTLNNNENITLESNLSTNDNALEQNSSVISEINNTNDLEQNETKEIATIQSAAIKPKAKSLWIGVFNLNNKKRVSKIVKKEFALNLNDGKIAIVTGHSKFDIITNDGVKSFDGKGKRYLVVSKEEGVKEITKQEYKDLTKNRAW